MEKEKDKYENFIDKKLAEIEDRNRRSNLRFDNIEEGEKETWEESETKVKKVMKDLGIEKKVEIEHAHRTGDKREGKKRTIVVKILHYKDKELIMKKYVERKLWNEHKYINDDYSEYTVKIRK